MKKTPLMARAEEPPVPRPSCTACGKSDANTVPCHWCDKPFCGECYWGDYGHAERHTVAGHEGAGP